MPRNNPTQAVPVRLDEGTLALVERYQARLTSQAPGVNVSRGDALRALILAGLNAVDGRGTVEGSKVTVELADFELAGLRAEAAFRHTSEAAVLREHCEQLGRIHAHQATARKS